jgi:hypothetical protein
MTFEDKNISPPDGIRTEVFTIRPIKVTDVELDYAAVMESREFLRKWEQSTWPEDDFTVEDNLEDMQKMQERHATGYSYGYTVMNPDETECLGCVYVFAPTAKMFLDAEITEVGDAAWADAEAMVFFWIRKSRLAEEMDRHLLEVLRQWFETDWPFDRVHYMTSEQFEQQVALLESTDLVLEFKTKRPSEPGPALAYAVPPS